MIVIYDSDTLTYVNHSVIVIIIDNSDATHIFMVYVNYNIHVKKNKHGG